MVQRHTKLNDLGHYDQGASGLIYVLRKLNEADELESGLAWSDEVWEGVTVEELIGALIGADQILTLYDGLRFDEPLHPKDKPRLDVNHERWSEYPSLNFRES